MLNAADTIIAEKRRCLYLAASMAIVEEQQKKIEEAGEQEKATPPRLEERHRGKCGQGMVDQKARVWTV